MSFLKPIWNGSGFGNNPPGAGRPGKRAPKAIRRCHARFKARAGRYWPDPDANELAEIKLTIRNQMHFVLMRNSDPNVEAVLEMLRLVMRSQGRG